MTLFYCRASGTGSNNFPNFHSTMPVFVTSFSHPTERQSSSGKVWSLMDSQGGVVCYRGLKIFQLWITFSLNTHHLRGSFSWRTSHQQWTFSLYWKVLICVIWVLGHFLLPPMTTSTNLLDTSETTNQCWIQKKIYWISALILWILLRIYYSLTL